MSILESKELPKKVLPPIVKQSASYKLIIPQEVEEKIRYLLRKFPSTEWSGVLFTTYEGTFENNDLVITCHDIFPMDLGNATYTDFKMNEDVAKYIADNIELFDCDCQLIHSHHQMQAFFSGTDVATLQEEGNYRNCFVSLIVNNAGEYCAAVTRKIKSISEVTVKQLEKSYEFFGEGTINTPVEPESTDTYQEEVIEYFMLDIEKPDVSNPLSYLDERFDEIQKKKTAHSYNPASPSISHSSHSSYNPHNSPYLPLEDADDFYSWIHEKDKAEQLSIWEDIPVEDKLIDATKIKEAVAYILTCSLCINPNTFDLETWVKKQMESSYKKAFEVGYEGYFDEWAEFIIEFIINKFVFSAPVSDDALDEYQSEVAAALEKELLKYKEYSEYIVKYCEILERYFV